MNEKIKSFALKRIGMIKNFGFNLFAAILSTGVLQLVVYPFLARRHSEGEYGEILLIVGVVNVFILTFGNSLGDIRLILNADTEKKETNTDFNIFLLFASIVGVIVFSVFAFVHKSVSLNNYILLGAFCIVGIIHSYLIALIRLKLLFVKSVVASLFMTVGYIIGMILCYFTHVWAVVFLVAYLVSTAYLAFITGFMKDGFKKTNRMRRIMGQYSQLATSYGLKSGLTYIDRFTIYPLMGNDTVAIYTVASIFGKCVLLVLQPIANVILGYYVQPGYKMGRKKYWIINSVSLSFGLIAFVFALIFSKLFVKILYPTYIDLVLPYLAIANLATIIGALISLVQPSLLKFASMTWQIIIQVAYGVLCVSLSLILIPVHGLMGFCYSMLISNSARLAFMFVVGDIGIVRAEKNDKL